MRLMLIALVTMIAACGEPTLQTTSQEPVAVAATPEQLTERLHAWLDEQYEAQLDFSPMTRTRLGDKTDYGELDDYSEAGELEELQWLRDSVASMREQFDPESLSEEGRLSYRMWEYSLEQAEAAWPFRSQATVYGRLGYGRGGMHTFLPSFLISFHRVDNAADVEAYLARLRGLDQVFDDVLTRLQSAAEAGIRQPRFGYDFALAEIERVTSGVPFNNSDESPNSPLWIDLQDKLQTLVESGELDEAQGQRFLGEAREILAGPVLAAYEEIAAWLETDRGLAEEPPLGVWALPDGEAFYNQRLQQMTTTSLTAQEIHDIGLSEVERLLTAMEAVKEEAEFDGTLQEFFVFLREDPQFYYANTEADREEYLRVNNEYLDSINERLPQFFGRLPRAPLEVRRVESFREQDGAAQHYRAGSPDGSRPGVFYSHMSDMSTLAKWQIEDIAYHEGNPGHHMQISIQQELTEVPRFRTQYRAIAYSEGWGLYAEWLAREMGGYQDPYAEFGQLAGEMWRACRLVVDTGIHALQWSEEQAIDYFLTNSPVPEGAVRSEVERYFANPGQATAYKIGMLNFQEARARAEAELGDAFDIRAFHDVVLGAGALPMPIMQERVDRWIDETLAANP